MYWFTHWLTPAIMQHVKSQFSVLNDMSQMLLDTVQKLNELNVQAAKRVMEESVENAQHLLAVKDPFEAFSIIAEQAQPTADKFKSYQQHLANIAAGTQYGLAKTAKAQVPEARPTATALAAATAVEDVVRNAAEETAKIAKRQSASMEKLANLISKYSEQDKGSRRGSRKNMH